MNIVLWVLQVALAWFCIAGGAFQIFKFDDLKKGVMAMRETPKGLWAVLGAVGVIGGLLLILPGLLHFLPSLTPIAAVAIALENVVIAVLYRRHGDRAPLPYAIVIIVLALLVAYGRLVLSPFVA